MYKTSSSANETALRVLIVDDNDQLRAIMTEGMNRLGYATDAAADGLEAAQLLVARSYDAIICDLLMPHISGVDLYERCCLEHPEAARRFVFLTGSPLGVSAASQADFSGQPCLTKPCRLSDVRDAISSLQSPLVDRALVGLERGCNVRLLCSPEGHVD